MSKRPEKLIIGPRLKALRQSLGLTQAQLAAELDVSPSYITLIEANQRPASARLLMRLAEVYDLNVSELSPSADAQLATELAAALKDPVLEAQIGRAEVEQALNAAPGIAAALVRLHDKYRDLALRAGASPLSDRDKVEVLEESQRPVEAVRAWYYDHHNYIDPLDRAAEDLAEALKLHRTEPMIALTARLGTHGIRVRTLPAEVLAGQLRRFVPHHKELLLSELLGPESRRFQIAVLIARLEQEENIAAVTAASGLSGAAAALLRTSLANYFAAALTMPYRRFLAACESARYDLELLCHRFGASFEQTAHRMTTLQRPDARGVPFFFVRVDRAGNVSKRFSAGRFPFSKFGGTCPLWNIHSAFETSDQIRTQLIRMPEGASYLSIARCVTRIGGTHGNPAQKLAIGLGCDVAYAPRVVYGDALNLDRAIPTDIGLNCYLCERPSCASRAQAPINRKLVVHEHERGLAIFSFEGEQ